MSSAVAESLPLISRHIPGGFVGSTRILLGSTRRTLKPIESINEFVYAKSQDQIFVRENYAMRSLTSLCRIAAQTITAIVFCSAAFAYETRVEPDAHLVEGHLLAPGACMYDETGQCIYVAPVRFGEPIFINGRSFEAELNGKPTTFQQIRRLVMKPAGSVTYQDILNGVDPFYEFWGYAQTDDLRWISFNQLCRNDNTEVTLNSPSIHCNRSRCEVDVNYSVDGYNDTVEFEAEIEVRYMDGRKRTIEEDEYDYFASHSTEIDFNIPGPPDSVRSVTVTEVSCDIW